MVQCEMCGAETSDPKTVKVEGAELDVCSECADFGTEVKTQDTSSTSTKYSTGSSSTAGASSSSSSSRSSGSSSSGGGSRRRSDMFDDMGDLAQDYDEIIRQAREKNGLSQAELADDLNEKASLIRKLERGDTLPSDDVQRKLERKLDIDLGGGSASEEKEWSSDSSTTTTLGDVVKRKD